MERGKGICAVTSFVAACVATFGAAGAAGDAAPVRASAASLAGADHHARPSAATLIVSAGDGHGHGAGATIIAGGHVVSAQAGFGDGGGHGWGEQGKHSDEGNGHGWGSAFASSGSVSASGPGGSAQVTVGSHNVGVSVHAGGSSAQVTTGGGQSDNQGDGQGSGNARSSGSQSSGSQSKSSGSTAQGRVSNASVTSSGASVTSSSGSVCAGGCQASQPSPIFGIPAARPTSVATSTTPATSVAPAVLTPTVTPALSGPSSQPATSTGVTPASLPTPTISIPSFFSSSASGTASPKALGGGGGPGLSTGALGGALLGGVPAFPFTATGRAAPGALSSLLSPATLTSAIAAASQAHHSTGSGHSSRPSNSQPSRPNVIQRIEQVVPSEIWIALAAALGFAGIAGGVALWSGRRVRLQAGQFAAMRAAARTDPLTGVLNRRGFTEAVEREMSRARRYGRSFALAYVDVRGLKAVNDTEGHRAGDELLKGTANLLKDSARADDVVGRIGGDEMGVLLVEQQLEGADAVTHRIASRVADRRAELGLSTYWDLTIGTAAYPQDGSTVDELLQTADRRLYEQRGIQLR